MRLGEPSTGATSQELSAQLEAAVHLSSQAFALIGFFPQQLFTASIMLERFLVSLGSIPFEGL